MNKKETKADPSMNANPFAGDTFRIPVSQDLRNGRAAKPSDPATPVPTHHFIDRERHMKLFLSDAKREVLMSLTERAKCLVFFIQCFTPRWKDFIELSAARYTKETGVKSRVTFTLARAELIEKHIIIQSHIPGIYWINPRYLFPGSRPMHYPDNLDHQAPKRHDP